MRRTLFAFVALALASLLSGAAGSSALRATVVSEVASVALGGEHSCVVTNEGTVRCWGWNGDGQLGDGGSESHAVPVVVDALHEPTAQIATGYNHTCALASDRTVQCWGANANGQLGAVTAPCGTFACSRTPISVAGMDGVASIAAGYAHTCAIGSGRNLHCWGFNRYGQLGDGTKNDKLSPTLIIEGGVAAVAPGDVQTCAILVGATVQCWGNNLLGELGNASRAESLQPAEVCANASCTEVLADIVQLSAGDHHACGVDSAGSVYCWGSNIAGQLGVVANEGCPNAGHPCSTTPVLVPLAGPAASVSAGTASTCAVLVSGGIQCWGRQLDSPNAWDAPTTLEAWDSGISQLAAAKGHACVFTQEGMQCFGANGYGQLGDGTFVDRSATSPRRVWTLSGRGDADCDLNITSLDAALVLQRVAQLLVALPCPSVTAALDNQGSSTDALAILQFGAGLLT